MAQQPVQWGEWRPDIATTDTQFSVDVDNVFAATNAYMPVPDLEPFGGVVPPPPSTEKVVGLTSARTTTGEWKIYAGTPSKLYTWTFIAGWTEVGSGYHVGEGELWSFAQFGKFLIAVNIGDPPQACDVDAGGTFANLGGSPPTAHNVRVIGDFVFLGGLVSNRRKIMWSGVNDHTSWVPGINLCDEQEMPEGGSVQGVSGDKVGYIVQDRAIRTLQFMPGDTTFIFSISKVVYDRGSVSEYGFVSIGDTLYFLADDGFYALTGPNLTPIGHEKVNEWFLANSDIGRRNLVQCFLAVRPYICWPYHSSSASPMYDKVMVYNWSNQRWTKVSVMARMWATAATIALDLDTTGPEPGDEWLDSPPAPLPPDAPQPLDSFAYVGGRPLIAAIDVNGNLSTLTGPNLQATMESAEHHPVPGMRALVGDVYPLSDAAEGVIYNGYRERLQDPVQWTQAYPIEVTGSAAIYNSSRLHRFRQIIPRASAWKNAQGLLVDAQQDGSVA
jgi:hypothetical protein